MSDQNHAQEPQNAAVEINTSQKRKRIEAIAGPTRRSTNACHRCKNKKLKCHFTGHVQDKCAACIKANSDCIFDALPDGVPRGAEYVSTLEARIAFLEAELRGGNPAPTPLDEHLRNEDNRNVQNPLPTVPRTEANTVRAVREGNYTAPGSRLGPNRGFSFTELVERHVVHGRSNQQKSPESTSEITNFNMLQVGTTVSEMQAASLPELPSTEVGTLLLETVYMYTQARYCIVDWARLRTWHQCRETICYSTKEDDLDAQIGAYFVWIVYAIGAGFVPNPEYPPKAYFARALKYLHAVLTLQDLTTVQGLLCLSQYHFRATGGPSVWHLSGITMRLCIELGFHRTSMKRANTKDPLTIELEKRFFWCAYCFDRLVSTIARRPFGIYDLDIDVEVPINVDVDCTDNERIQHLQICQAASEDDGQAGTITSMSSALHHLEIYRLRSRIMTRFFGPHALTPTYDDVKGFLAELEDWRAAAPQRSPARCPQQSDERKQGFYLQTVLLSLRPVLMQNAVDQNLLRLCAEKAAEACENGRLLSLSPQTHPSLTDLYQNFYCGVTLLQCLALQQSILAPRQVARAIVACSSTLSVYTRQFAIGAPFLELFEKLSDRFLGDGGDVGMCDPSSMLRLRSTLQEIMSSNPSETSKMVRRALSEDDSQIPGPTTLDSAGNDHHIPMTGDFSSVMGISDVTMPFDMPFDMYAMDGSFQDATDFWSGLQ